MNRLLQAMVAVVGSVALVSPLAVGAVANGVAEAAPTAVSPAGTYNVTIVKLLSASLTIKKNGQFAFAGGPKGTWSETKNVIQMDGTLGTYTYVFVIQQVGANLGSPTKTGTVTLNRAKWGRWYGVRS
jgi:hypothetical protein